jgi:hypothetical protein
MTTEKLNEILEELGIIDKAQSAEELVQELLE